MARFNVSAIGAVEADCALGSAAGFGAEVSCASTSKQKLINVATPTTVRSSRIFRLLGYQLKTFQFLISRPMPFTSLVSQRFHRLQARRLIGRQISKKQT